MVQLYFLGVFLNLAGGLSLCAHLLRGGPDPWASLGNVLLHRGIRHALGLAMLVVAVLEYMDPMGGDLPVVGDFIPATTGLAAGVALLQQTYRRAGGRKDEGSGSTGSNPAMARIGRILGENGTAIGLAAIVSGLLHFAFPSVLFL